MTNKKDYFKGLGTGIIVASALFFIFVYFSWPSPPSNVDESNPTTNTVVDTTGKEIEGASVVEVETEKTANADEDEDTKDKDLKESDVEEEKPLDNTIEDEVVNVVIPAGYTSNGVGIILYEHGIIENYAAFNEYSMRIKKDYSIRSGTYQLTKGASFNEILAIIAP